MGVSLNVYSCVCFKLRICVCGVQFNKKEMTKVFQVMTAHLTLLK